MRVLSQLNRLDNCLLLLIKIGLLLVLFLPLVVIDGFYFPFIVPRNLFFRLIIDIIFGLYFYLILTNKSFRPKFNKAFIFIFLFVIGLTVSSLLGMNFSFSFWSNFERMDGLVNWYHLLMYIFVLLGVVNSTKSWRQLLNISLIAAWLVALVALGQQFNLNFILPSYGGGRLTSTLGNAAYVGSYMFLQTVVAVYLLFNRLRLKGWSFLNFWYILSVGLFIFILIVTQTRGAFLGLAFFIFLLIIFYLWFKRRERKAGYYFALGILLASFLLLGLLWQQKDSAWVDRIHLAYKLTHISLNDITTQSRLTIWRNSWRGVQERPLLGWGEENFHYVFNGYFPIEIFRDESSELWFDRPHNILVQHLVQGGIVGFFLYLSVFVFLIFYLYQKYKQDNDWFFSFFWIAFLISFLFHDFFIFDNLNTNLILYLILSFLFMVGVKQQKRDHIPFKRGHGVHALLSLMIIISFSLTFFWNPLGSNLLLTKSFRNISLARDQQSFDQALEEWQRSFTLSSLGEKEKVEVLLQMMLNVSTNPYLDDQSKTKLFVLVEGYLEEESKRHPYDVRLNMMLSSFYSDFATIDQEFILKNLDLLNKLKNQAPQRPDIYLQLTRTYLIFGDIQAAEENAIELKNLAPWAKPVYWNLFQVYLISGDLSGMEENLNKIREINFSERKQALTDDEYQHLQQFARQLEENNQSALAEMINSFIR
ncbi:MAG: hypothetical protein COV55_00870 [Candidatus Komeilibacteria bacterium CG11_big_fil_rev_8_21_14_0_20_36_20]|uniref:O-antigen ligase-related domain-containing protein n=1 Tax=Candidatus Komeilibacteria bacterium CG11_big_fil_rev_8_21_14_0_20_36_20 TaxID=1974477 RepID=A0A2H0NDJ0_9BACT|nr:MAG: hypothetical protein COV55_00870 [Candidatus Komeilibacteria bacterium CG11_big_fil_rev_8_21_14_0_20_36_20]PIR81332.1 MAG: hypothetical protein COU21_03840 [Candidatus Komeilibacteria bacterium CG10_big_fil_rev_8_21_14_0_10_36_65]PJC54962.1 MAG: hypothetical protein CO027_04510 [Candidatus Komeilibacteria bacterium CG_4_9_14_0_2_um_filter_36_13]